MPRKRKRKLPRRKAQHPQIGSAMNVDRRQAPERRAGDIYGWCPHCKGSHGTEMNC